MATLFASLLLLLLTSLFVSITSVNILETPSDSTPTTNTFPVPPPFNLFQSTSPFLPVIPILTDLGYRELALAAHTLTASSNAAGAWPGPITVFAPTDSAVRSCPSCSLPLLLQEHSVPGLFPTDYLRKLTFGTRIETILPGRCLTVTSAVNNSKIFIGGAEITHPQLFDNGHMIVHGIQGFISHLSPYSCFLDKMTSLSLPRPSPALTLMRAMLIDALARLRTSGYSILALAVRMKFPELVTLHNMTIFALDDVSIFRGGHSYVRELRYHIVPNRMLMLADLEKLPASTVLPTLVNDEFLMVTTAGGGGILAPLRVNYVRIKVPDLIYNPYIVIHGLALPLPHLHQSVDAAAIGRSGGYNIPDVTKASSQNVRGSNEVSTPSPHFAYEVEDHHGL